MDPFTTSMYVYMGLGTLVCVPNGVLTMCIVCSRNNRSRREFLLIVSQCAADTIYAVAFIFIAAHRLHLAATEPLNAATLTRWECARLPGFVLHHLAAPLLGLVPLAMSVNFLISSIFPLWYMSSRSAYTASLIAVPYGISFVVLVTNYALLWSDKIRVSALCLATAGAVHPVSYGIMITIRLLSNFGSAVVYISIITYMTSIHNRTLLIISSSQKKLYRTAKFTLGMVTLNSISLLFIPDVLLLINPFNIAQKYATFLYSLTLTKVKLHGTIENNSNIRRANIFVVPSAQENFAHVDAKMSNYLALKVSLAELSL